MTILCVVFLALCIPLWYLTVIMHWFRVRSVSQIPFGKFWGYLVEVKNRTRQRVAYNNGNSGFLIFEVIFLCFVTLIPFGSFDGILNECRTGRDDVSRTRITNLPFLLLALSPFVIFDSDYALISYPLCKSNTLWNIIRIIDKHAEQDKTTCREQEWQLWISYSWSYLFLFCFWN